MIKVKEIIKMGTQDIMNMITDVEYDNIVNLGISKERFVELYREGAEQSNDDEFITPSQYIEYLQERAEYKDLQ